MLSPLQVLFEDNHCLAVVKPARLLTAGDSTGDATLLDQARAYLREKYRKPGNVYLGLVHRLDRPVSGIVLFARTSKAASRLSAQFRAGSVLKVYHALVEGVPARDTAELVDWLVKDAAANRVDSVSPDTPGARRSVLQYQRLSRRSGLTLIEIAPQTGRSHQIRVQLAHAGMPIFGDRKYGARHGFDGAIALHAARLTFEHPVRRDPIMLSCGAPAAWASLASRRIDRD